MTELNTQTQVIELTDDQLELVEGGGMPPELLEALHKHFFVPLFD